jgi:large subunit ribosomal protein L23
MILDLVKYPAVNTEKYAGLIERHKQYSFDVDGRLTKPQIRKLIEELLGVKVLAINTHRPPRKNKRFGSKASLKRVILTVDSSIDLINK